MNVRHPHAATPSLPSSNSLILQPTLSLQCILCFYRPVMTVIYKASYWQGPAQQMVLMVLPVQSPLV